MEYITRMEHATNTSFRQCDLRKSRFWVFVFCLVITVTIVNIFEPYHLNLKLLTRGRLNMLIGITKEIIETPHPPLFVGELEPTCDYSGGLSDYCMMKGDVRVEAKSNTIFLVSPYGPLPAKKKNISWSIRPYARKDLPFAMSYVTKWTIKILGSDSEKSIPKCSQNYNTPAIVFSTRGFTKNTFHTFSDLLIPIFATSQQFNGDVRFLITDYREWLIAKYKLIFSKLSKYPIIPIDKEMKIHCFPKMILGTKSHRDMGIKSSEFPDGLSMDHFRKFMRATYSLERTTVTARMIKGDGRKKPRLMVLNRKETRVIMNVDEISQMAEELGFEVIIDDLTYSTNITWFAQMVNSCDALMGVHGAGLTSLVYLPDNAVFIQIVPVGVEYLATRYYGKAMNHMTLNYLEYKITIAESSLIEQYPVDHAVLKDPNSITKQGWEMFKSIYLDKQNVSIDSHRFRSTLAKTIKILIGDVTN